MKEAEDQGLLKRAREVGVTWRPGRPWIFDRLDLFQGENGLCVLYWSNSAGHGINVYT